MRNATQIGVVLVVLVVLLGSLPGVVAAQTSRVGGAIVVEEGEVIDGDLQAVGGSIVVYGTVHGDVQAAAGDILIVGTVTGDVEAAAGAITVTGDVGGNLQSGAGSLTIDEGATIGGNVDAGAASAVIAGTVQGDVTVGGDTITLAPTADVGGDLVYDGQLIQQPGASVAGAVRQDPNLGGWSVGPVVEIPDFVGTIYSVLVSFLLGGLLLVLFPAFTDEVSGQVRGDAIQSSFVALVAILASVLAILLVAITIIGIPLAILLAFAVGLTAWVGSVLGQYAVGDYVLRQSGREDRWLALALGVLGFAVLDLVPIVGGVATFLVGLLGFGATVAVLYDRYVGGRNEDRETPGPTSA
jgi:cytoskeletal protein CcmA (bactofilin family)